MGKKKSVEEVLAGIKDIELVDHVYVDDEGKIATRVEGVNEALGQAKVRTKEIEIFADRERNKTSE